MNRFEAAAAWGRISEEIALAELARPFMVWASEQKRDLQLQRLDTAAFRIHMAASHPAAPFIRHLADKLGLSPKIVGFDVNFTGEPADFAEIVPKELGANPPTYSGSRL